jgi:RHS repeat-associated protein
VAFYDSDASGSTAALTGSDGSVVNRYSYLPFGEPLTRSETVPNSFEYVGQFGVQRDGSGLDYMRERYYAAAAGRFLHEDPIGVLGGFNLHRYVDNDPVQRIDPSGLSFMIYVGTESLTIFVDALIGIEELLAATAAEAAAAEVASFEAAATIETAALTGPTSGSALGGFIATDLLIGFGAVVGAAAAGVVAGNGFNEIAEFTSGMTLGDAVCDLTDCDDPDFDFPVPESDETLDDKRTRQVGSFDPNDIIGPVGFGPEQFVPADASLFYTIHFENLATATAPAQTVVVTQTLDPDLDLTTFEFMSFGIGASVVNLPAERSFFSLRFDLRPDRNLLLDVGAELNVETGVITWTFTSLDPVTLELPDALGDIGFLPPNQSPPAGEGFVTYVVRPKQALPSGTGIDAEASIVFDVNAPLDTPALLHTLDAGGPASSVDPLPAVTLTESFTVAWSGGDDAGGSGIADYDVYASIDGGPFLPWLRHTVDAAGVYIGQAGHSYAFFSIARDHVGHVESLPATADATTFVGNTPPLAQDDNYSVGENAVLTVSATEGVLMNDTDQEENPIHAELVRNALHGTVTLHADGSFEYTPGITPNRKYWDWFEYQANDGTDTSIPAIVSITIDTHFPWHNNEEPLDVSDDSSISAVDALQVINELNRHGTYQLPTSRPRPLTWPFLDVYRDGFVSPRDALRVINHLNHDDGQGDEATTNDFSASLTITQETMQNHSPSSIGNQVQVRDVREARDEPLNQPSQHAWQSVGESGDRGVARDPWCPIDDHGPREDVESTLDALVDTLVDNGFDGELKRKRDRDI